MPASRPLPERFWEKVVPDPETGCLLWTASLDRNGYGRIGVDGAMKYAHRVAWFLAYDEWPEHTLDHVKSRGCRYRHCVNVAHLEDVTQGENVRRGDAGKHVRARAALITHCPQGHEYTPANTYVRPSGKRQCRACGRDRRRAYVARKRQERDRG